MRWLQLLLFGAAVTCGAATSNTEPTTSVTRLHGKLISSMAVRTGTRVCRNRLTPLLLLVGATFAFKYTPLGHVSFVYHDAFLQPGSTAHRLTLKFDVAANWLDPCEVSAARSS